MHRVHHINRGSGCLANTNGPKNGGTAASQPVGRRIAFRKSYGKWLPYLTAWDATLRLIASEARIRVKFKPWAHRLGARDDLGGLHPAPLLTLRADHDVDGKDALQQRGPIDAGRGCRLGTPA